MLRGYKLESLLPSVSNSKPIDLDTDLNIRLDIDLDIHLDIGLDMESKTMLRR